MKKFLFVATFTAASFAIPAYSEGMQDCANANACHYNDASINKGDTSNTQNVGDHQNNTYAPDSANANAHNDVTIGDNIAQGGTGGSAEASGNYSHNANNSNANIGANSQSNTGNNNTNTGGNFSQGPQTGGNFSQGSQVGGSIGDTIGGNAQGGMAQGGNVQGGEAHTNSGNIDNTSGVTGSGNSANRNDNRNSQGQGQEQQQSSRSNSKATGGDSKSVSNASGGNSRNTVGQANQQQTNIDASQRTTIRHAAHSAWAPQLNGYGPGNCFGDTNPSGSFTAGMQTFMWGVTAGRSKASNVCAVAMAGGPRAAAAYLAAQDPNAHRALVAAGVVTTPSRQKNAFELATAVCQVVKRHRNGMPREVKAYAKQGIPSDQALSDCLASMNLMRVK